MKNTMTRIDAMNICKAMVENSGRPDADEVIAILDKQIESFARKSVSKADKIKADENARIRASILDILAGGKEMRISDITKAVNGAMGTDFSSNKVSAQVTILKNGGEVTRTEVKKVAYFTVA